MTRKTTSVRVPATSVLDPPRWRQECGPRNRAAVVIFVVTAAPGVSVAAGTLPDFQFDPVEDWAARILVWVLLVSLAAVGYLLMRSLRGRLDGLVGKGLLITGVVLLPTFSVATGMLQASFAAFFGSVTCKAPSTSVAFASIVSTLRGLVK